MLLRLPDRYSSHTPPFLLPYLTLPYIPNVCCVKIQYMRCTLDVTMN